MKALIFNGLLRRTGLRGVALVLYCSIACCPCVQAQTQLPENVRAAALSFLDRIGQAGEVKEFELTRIGSWKIMTATSDTITLDAQTCTVTHFIEGDGKPIYELANDQAAIAFGNAWLTMGGLSPKIDLVATKVNDQTWNLISDEPLVNGLPSGGLKRLVLTIDRSTGVVAMFSQPPYQFPSPSPRTSLQQAVEIAESRSEIILGKRAKVIKGPTLAYATPAMATGEWTTPGFRPQPDSRVAALVYLVMLEGEVAVTIDADSGCVWNGGTAKGPVPLTSRGDLGSSRAKKREQVQKKENPPFALFAGGTIIAVLAAWLAVRKR